MSKPKYKIEIESWIVLVFAVVILVVTLLNKFFPTLDIKQFFTSPTAKEGVYPFSFTDPLSYVRILFHIFGAFSTASIACCLCIIAIVPNAERDFGTIPLIIMVVLATIFAGVLNSCFNKNAISGVEPIVYLLLFLNIFSGVKKKKIFVLQLVFLAVLITWSILLQENTDIISVLVQIAGGLCGSLVSFLTMPKSNKTKKVKLEFNNEADSPRFKKKKSKPSDDETTVVGTIEL